jgi:hypothetical protein
VLSCSILILLSRRAPCAFQPSSSGSPRSKKKFAAGLLDPFLLLLEVVALEDEMVDPGLFEPA